MKRILISLFFTVALGAGITALYYPPKNGGVATLIETTAEQEQLMPPEAEEKILPSSFLIDIPFTVQAPLADWSWPFQHSCEEASVLMARQYIKKQRLTPEEAQKEILAMNDFENKKYPLAHSSAAQQTAIFIKDYYGYDAEARYDISLDDIKRELVAGNLVLVPAAGRLLKNPHFKTPGPLYHMVIVKGYTPSEIIVNDPGTRHGADFRYSYETFEGAISDWDLEDWDTAVNVNGRKATIVISL